VTATDWDAIAAEVGLPTDWREAGFDSPEYMQQPDSLYRPLRWVDGQYVSDTTALECVFPGCTFRRQSAEAMFRHVHGSRHQLLEVDG